MSGGHYNYAYTKFLQLAEDIDADLNDKELDKSEETKELMRAIRLEVLQTARKAKALEWMMTGDYDEDTFQDVMKELPNPNISESSVWGM